MLKVCRSSATRQGAQDFFSNRIILARALQATVDKATALACKGEEFCFVVIDGTALTLTGWQRQKDFGAIGATKLGARGNFGCGGRSYFCAPLWSASLPSTPPKMRVKTSLSMPIACSAKSPVSPANA